jgi:uncharacterized flavoprotein (TIGR03862 family)
MVRQVSSPKRCAVIGGGPAGLIAAEWLAKAGHRVSVYDRMPSPARKFLLAGRGGLNLTHSEPLDVFLSRYQAQEGWLRPMLKAFSPDDVRAWCADLGEPGFVGSSGRIFPKSFKASPLLRAWLRRLDGLGVIFHARHHWQGFDRQGALLFETPGQDLKRITPDATILALGGASWPKLGSDGAWTNILGEKGVAVRSLEASNTGVRVGWSEAIKNRFAGHPLKRIVVSCGGAEAKGEAIITASGLEGGVIYALGPAIRRELVGQGQAMLYLDLRRDLTIEALTLRLAQPRGKASLSTWLQKAAGLTPESIALLYETKANGNEDGFKVADPLARLIKRLPIKVEGLSGLERAISTHGGIDTSELDERLMLKRLPGVFAAGEMLDWDAPTGGYLLQACFSTGVAAARGVEEWLKQRGERGEP